MTEQSREPEATASEPQPTDLLDSLRELGQALPVSFQPNSHDAGPLLAGVIFYLATGSLEAPKVDVPNQAEVNAELQEQTRLNEAESRIAELQRQLAAKDAGPSPVAPPPIAAVEPTPAAPVDAPAPGAETPQATAPVDAPAPGTREPTEAEMVAAWQAAQGTPTAPEGTVGS